MRSTVKVVALAILVSTLALANLSAAEKSQPSADPGEQIKNGFVSIGHGIRDGAKRAWGAVKSAVGGDADTSKKRN